MAGGQREEEAATAAAETHVCFIGFGDLATSWAGGLRDCAGVRVSAYLPATSTTRGKATWDMRVQKAGITPLDDLGVALGEADLVVAAVPASQAAAVAEESLPHLRRDALFVDPSSGSPAGKAAIASRVARRGALYVDVAVLGTVSMSGLQVPLLAAGPGAARFAQLAQRFGMSVTAVGEEPGDAARIKLVRSVYMKGRDALLVEMIVAARQIGAERQVIDSIAQAPGERVPFDQLVERVMPALTRHAGRRADELGSSAEELRRLGVEPMMTEAAERRLRRMAEETQRD